MDGWTLFWKFVLIATVLTYFPLSLAVAIFGAVDCKRLLTDMAADNAKKE
jgi:hypothetical protein